MSHACVIACQKCLLKINHGSGGLGMQNTELTLPDPYAVKVVENHEITHPTTSMRMHVQSTICIHDY